MKAFSSNGYFSWILMVGLCLGYGQWGAGQSSATDPPVADIAFADDGDSVFVVSQNGIRCLEWPSLQQRRSLDVSFANLHCVALSPNGKRLAVGGGDPSEFGAVDVFAWPDGRKLATISAHEDSVTSLVWRNEDQLFTASLDRTIVLCDIPQEMAVRSFEGHSRGVSGITLITPGSTLLSVAHDQSLRVWDGSDSQLLRSLSQHTQLIHGVAGNPQREGLPVVATASKDRTLRFWQPTIGRMMRYVRLESEPLDLVWTQGGERIVAACGDGQIRVVDPLEVKVLHVLPAIDGWAYAVAAHPSDGSILVGGTNGQLSRIVLPTE